MYLYFLLIRIAALLGHSKARMMVGGLKQQKIQSFKDPVWIHAASVGEFEQARPLIEKLRREQPQQRIVLTFFSPSGYEMRKNYSCVDAVYYLPFATHGNAKRFMDVLRPKMAVFVKYEFWPAYLRELKKRNIPTYSICAIFRPKQWFFRPWGKAYANLLKCFTHIYVQDENSYRLLLDHGITACSVAGDTRFDRVKEVCSNQEDLPLVVRFIKNARMVIVAGSTWPEDEALLAKFLENSPVGTKLILVPHEIDQKHMHYIFNLFKGRMVRWSRLLNSTPVPLPDVLVIDTMGLLSRLYRYGRVAYVGGGFGAGIHNTIEAAVYGVPVIFGPKCYNFREAKGLIDAGAAKCVKNYTELENALNYALDNHIEMGEKAAEYVISELGTTDKIYNDLF